MKSLLKVAASTLFAAGLVVAEARAELPDFTGLVEQVSPAVVNVSATHTAEAQSRDPQQIEEGDLPEILRRFYGMPGQPQAPRDSTSLGTGFVISADGYVLTKNIKADARFEGIPQAGWQAWQND